MGVQWGSVEFRGFPLRPFSVLIAHLLPPPDQYQAFRDHRNVMYWGRGGWKREEQKRGNAGKSWILGRNSRLWVFCGVPWLPIVPILPFSVRLAPISPPNQYLAFRNRRNVRYWGRGKGENEESKSGKTAIISWM